MDLADEFVAAFEELERRKVAVRVQGQVVKDIESKLRTHMDCVGQRCIHHQHQLVKYEKTFRKEYMSRQRLFELLSEIVPDVEHVEEYTNHVWSNRNTIETKKLVCCESNKRPRTDA